VSEFISLEGQDLISPNLHTIRNTLFANYIFHFPLMKVEGSAEMLGLLETLNIIYTIFNQSNIFYFLICFHHLVTGPFLKPLQYCEKIMPIFVCKLVHFERDNAENVVLTKRMSFTCIKVRKGFVIVAFMERKDRIINSGQCCSQL